MSTIFSMSSIQLLIWSVCNRAYKINCKRSHHLRGEYSLRFHRTRYTMGFFNRKKAAAIACWVAAFALLFITLQNAILRPSVPRRDPDIPVHGFGITQTSTFANHSQLYVQRLLEELTPEDDFESLFYKVDIVGELKQSVKAVRI